MTKYTVYKILTVGSCSLLLVNEGEKISMSVYDEHSGNTLLRLVDPTLEHFEHAIALIKGNANGQTE
jgi:hypothetical protein